MCVLSGTFLGRTRACLRGVARGKSQDPEMFPLLGASELWSLHLVNKSISSATEKAWRHVRAKTVMAGMAPWNASVPASVETAATQDIREMVENRAREIWKEMGGK